MKFHMTSVAHHWTGKLTLRDMTASIAAGLRELNHDVTVSETEAQRGAINLLFEYMELDFARELAASGLDYAIITTEMPPAPGKEGFNSRVDGNWLSRWEGFKIAAPRAKFIWSNVPAPYMEYWRQFAPTAHITYGYADALLAPGPVPKPTHRWGFPGMLTPHRQSILDRLGDRVATSHNGPYRVKDEAMLTVMARGVTTLGLRQDATWPMPSTSRLSVALHARIPYLAEWTPIETIVSRIPSTCPRGTDFVTWLECQDEDPDVWARVADDHLQEFEQIKMRDCVARALGGVGL